MNINKALLAMALGLALAAAGEQENAEKDLSKQDPKVDEGACEGSGASGADDAAGQA